MAIPTEQSFLTTSQNDDNCTHTKNEKKVDRASPSFSYIIGTIVVSLVTLSFLYTGGSTTTITTPPYSSNYGSAEAETNLLRSNTVGGSMGTNEMGMGEGEGFIPKLKHAILHIKHIKKKLKHQKAKAGAAYTLSNNDSANELIVFARDGVTGVLSFSHAVSMHGRGVDLSPIAKRGSDPLKSQDPLIVDATGTCIIGVNAGSHTVATLKINNAHDPTDVTFVATYNSGGVFPVSVLDGERGVIYVLNAGENGLIQAFQLNTHGCTLTAFELGPAFHSLPEQQTGLVGETKPVDRGPSDMLISQDKNILYVIMKSANNITPATPGSGRLIKYDIKTGTSNVAPVPGVVVPYAMVMNEDGIILLANAGGGSLTTTGGVVVAITPSNSVSSKDTFHTDTFLPTGFRATCWIRYSSKKSNGCSYVTNAGPIEFGGATITAFRSAGTQLEVMAPNPADTITSPLDLFFSPDERFLYVVSTGYQLSADKTQQQPSIHGYEINTTNCGLIPVTTIEEGLPTLGTNPNSIAGIVVV